MHDLSKARGQSKARARDALLWAVLGVAACSGGGWGEADARDAEQTATDSGGGGRGSDADSGSPDREPNQDAAVDPAGDAEARHDADVRPGVYPCRAESDGLTTVVFVNRCGELLQARGVSWRTLPSRRAASPAATSAPTRSTSPQSAIGGFSPRTPATVGTAWPS